MGGGGGWDAGLDGRAGGNGRGDGEQDEREGEDEGLSERREREEAEAEGLEEKVREEEADGGKVGDVSTFSSLWPQIGRPCSWLTSPLYGLRVLRWT